MLHNENIGQHFCILNLFQMRYVVQLLLVKFDVTKQLKVKPNKDILNLLLVTFFHVSLLLLVFVYIRLWRIRTYQELGYLHPYRLCLSVCLSVSINVKTAEPIGTNFLKKFTWPQKNIMDGKRSNILPGKNVDIYHC